MKTTYTDEEKQILKEELKKVSIGANDTIAKLLLILGAFALFTALLFICGIFQITSPLIVVCTLLVNTILLFTVAAIEMKLQGQYGWLKYLLFHALLLFLLILNIALNYRCYPLYILPILLSMRYSSKKFTIKMYIGVMIILFTTIIANAYTYPLLGYIDLSTVSFTTEQNITASGFLYSSIVAAHPDQMTILKNGLRTVGISYSLIFTLLTICAILLLNYVDGLLLTLYKRMQIESDMKLQLAESNTKLTLSQLKPHFLYNTLTSIIELCTSDPDEAGRVTREFARYLRGNMSAVNGTEKMPFSKELEHVKVYADIEQVRFGDRLKMHYNIQEQVFTLPTLTLQPIVENAIKHGIMHKLEGGNVWIDSVKGNGVYVITVKDDGVGFDPETCIKDDHKHVGISLVRTRIEHMGGTLEIQSVIDEGTVVTIRVPENS